MSREWQEAEDEELSLSPGRRRSRLACLDQLRIVVGKCCYEPSPCGLRFLLTVGTSK